MPPHGPFNSRPLCSRPKRTAEENSQGGQHVVGYAMMMRTRPTCQRAWPVCTWPNALFRFSMMRNASQGELAAATHPPIQPTTAERLRSAVETEKGKVGSRRHVHHLGVPRLRAYHCRLSTSFTFLLIVVHNAFCRLLNLGLSPTDCS